MKIALDLVRIETTRMRGAGPARVEALPARRNFTLDYMGMGRDGEAEFSINKAARLTRQSRARPD